jgi:hypothetical protein
MVADSQSTIRAKRLAALQASEQQGTRCLVAASAAQSHTRTEDFR